MAKYKIIRSKIFDKEFKRLSPTLKDETDIVLKKLENAEVLEPKYRNHKMKGAYKNIMNCHIRPDLVMFYKKLEDELIIIALRINTHSELNI